MKKYIVFDTNVFKKQGYFLKSDATALFIACQLAGYKVVIPETVVDEVVGNYAKEVRKGAAALQSAASSLRRFSSVQPLEFDPDQALLAYSQQLKKLLGHPNVSIASYPDISPKQLVEVAYTERKPFDVNGNGHKDYLIWQTILSVLQENEDVTEVVFVTDNTGDFGTKKGFKQKDGSFALHSDLAEDLGEFMEKVRCFTLIDEALNAVILPELNGLTVDALEGFEDELDDFVTTMISENLSNETFYGIEGLPFSNDVSVVGYGEAEDTTYEIYQYKDDVVVKVSAKVECHFDGFMDKWEYFSDFEDHGLSGGEMWNDHVVNVESVANVEFDILALFDPETSTFSGQTFVVTNEIDPGW